MTPRIELRPLRYFVAMVESGGLSAAARRLHVAQPALSHHLKQLESELGCRLLHREARGVRPTAEGESLFRHAVGLLRQLDGLPAAITADTRFPQGVVTVGLPPTLSGLLSLPVFETVLDRHPGIRLEIVEGHSRDLGRALLEGRIDLALMMPPGPAQGAVEQPVVAEELVIVCPAHAPWLPGGRQLSPADLRRMPMLLSSRRERLHALLSTRLSEERIDLDIRGHLDDLGALLAAVERGHGATVLPWCAASTALAAGRVVARRMKGRRLRRELLLCRSESLPLRDAVAATGGLVVRVVRELVDSGRWQTAQALPFHAARFGLPDAP